MDRIHPKTKAVITRCSQPKTGLAGKRNAADESLFESIRTHVCPPPHRGRLMYLACPAASNSCIVHLWACVLTF